MRHTRFGFTLVELLVVIAIIGILVSMIMPAIQSARESGRRTQCMNNLRNIGAASLQHLAAQKQFPTGGWGYAWGGDPDRGFDRKQPGGWGYNILPYIEESNLHDLGKSGSPSDYSTNQAKKDASRIRATTVLPFYLCVTRGRASMGPFWTGHQNVDMTNTPEAAKLDYAMNGGSAQTGWPAGPGVNALTQPDSAVASATESSAAANADGVSFIRSMVRDSHIRDGLAKTYLVGEKYLNYSTSGQGVNSGDDNQTWQVGFDWDTYRFTALPPEFDQNPDSTAMSVIFGSAHPTTFNMVMCDGSTRAIPYEIDPATHKALGGRKDGGPDGELPGN